MTCDLLRSRSVANVQGHVSKTAYGNDDQQVRPHFQNASEKCIGCVVCTAFLHMLSLLGGTACTTVR